MSERDVAILTCMRGDDGVAILALNRPDRLNALSHELLGQLFAKLSELDDDANTRAIVITGEGRAFSSGADLGGAPSDAEDVVRRLYNPLITLMIEMNTPIVAAVNGVTAGAAVSLALACDIRIADESSYFQVSFSRVGLVPDAGLTWLLPRMIGTGRAMEMSLLAQKIPSTLAHQWGLVNEVTAAGDALTRATEVARTLSALPSIVGTTRTLLHTSHSRDLASHLDAEASAQGIAQHSEDFQEVRAAFREGRKPNFERSPKSN
ncbi:enoyl-CoA hydratase/isomerase family protein [Rhodococcus qingshengii]|uniref:enoyl-CoA hydratase/isomerase family protein n=1 Tax=Rhodococcus qingshengii TaxID=334542 RepID=UPI0010A5F0FC|nr:enoyl-CoA hydratase-related protein [Rhodococcus qingshengii]THJ67694.1 2-(1,2-epoxy-1,2-dihydrophenyl)acetyl-CoA isomerase [Rhodococcus qingshengii]